MDNKKYKILIASFLIFTQILFLPFLAFAQLSVPTSNSALGTGDVLGTAANIAAQTELAGIDVLNQNCIVNEQAASAANTIDNLGFSGLALIGGDKVLLSSLSAAVANYNTQMLCRAAVLVALKAVVTPNLYTSNLKQRKEDEINLAIQGISERKTAAEARLNNAKQGFWKTLVFNILIKTSKSVASTLVGKLVNNYKIRDFKQYADSIATLVYDNQFIRQNYPDNQGQMMARAVLNNPLFRKEVPAAIFIAADAALGFDPKSLDPGDKNFYIKMASVGSAQANPYFQHNAYIANADLAHSTALAYSQNQISQSQGLKTPVNCAGSLAQQNAIDGQTVALENQLYDRQRLFDELTKAKNLGYDVLDSDIAKAQADLQTATEAWNNSADALPKGNAALAICEAIVSPPSLVNKGIDEAFKAIGINLAQYNENNLPAFMNIIGDVASQIGTSFVLGGAQGAKGSLLINEQKIVGAVSTAAGEYANANIAANLAKGIQMSFDTNSSVPNTFTLNWDIVAEQVPGASFVSIVGDGIASTTKDPKTGLNVALKYPLTGAVSFTTTKGGNYTITVYNSTGRSITSGIETLTVTNVLGAYTQREPLNIRGSVVHISPRGQ